MSDPNAKLNLTNKGQSMNKSVVVVVVEELEEEIQLVCCHWSDGAYGEEMCGVDIESGDFCLDHLSQH